MIVQLFAQKPRPEAPVKAPTQSIMKIKDTRQAPRRRRKTLFPNHETEEF